MKVMLRLPEKRLMIFQELPSGIILSIITLMHMNLRLSKVTKEEKNQENSSGTSKLPEYMCENLIRYLFGKISMFRAMCLKNWLHLKIWQIICGGRGTLKLNYYLREWTPVSYTHLRAHETV